MTEPNRRKWARILWDQHVQFINHEIIPPEFSALTRYVPRPLGPDTLLALILGRVVKKIVAQSPEPAEDDPGATLEQQIERARRFWIDMDFHPEDWQAEIEALGGKGDL